MRFGCWSRVVGACCFWLSGLGVAQVQQMPPGTSAPVVETRTPVQADPAVAPMQQAEDLMARQDWGGALAVLRPLVEKFPKNARALSDVGLCSESLNDAAGAKGAYEKAVAADAGAVRPRVALGLMLARAGDAGGAERLLAAAVALPGEGADGNGAEKAQAYRALARLHVAAAPEKARTELVAAIRRSREMPEDVLLAGEIAEALHDDAGAEEAYGRAMKADGGATGTVVAYARVLEREGKVEGARAALDGALRAHPDDPGLLSEKAGMLLRAKEMEAAMPLLERMHGLRPEDGAVSRLLARAYVAKGEYAKADPLFQQMLAADAASGTVRVDWADSLIRQKRNAEAEALLEKAEPLTFANPEERARAASELAFAAAANHHPETVVHAIAMRNAILAMDAPSAFLLATAHDNLHHPREAAGYYRQFLDLAHEHYPDEVWQARQRLQTLSRAK